MTVIHNPSKPVAMVLLAVDGKTVVAVAVDVDIVKDNSIHGLAGWLAINDTLREHLKQELAKSLYSSTGETIQHDTESTATDGNNSNG